MKKITFSLITCYLLLGLRGCVFATQENAQHATGESSTATNITLQGTHHKYIKQEQTFNGQPIYVVLPDNLAKQGMERGSFGLMWYNEFSHQGALSMPDGTATRSLFSPTTINSVFGYRRLLSRKEIKLESIHIIDSYFDLDALKNRDNIIAKLIDPIEKEYAQKNLDLVSKAVEASKAKNKPAIEVIKKLIDDKIALINTMPTSPEKTDSLKDYEELKNNLTEADALYPKVKYLHKIITTKMFCDLRYKVMNFSNKKFDLAVFAGPGYKADYISIKADTDILSDTEQDLLNVLTQIEYKDYPKEFKRSIENQDYTADGFGGHLGVNFGFSMSPKTRLSTNISLEGFYMKFDQDKFKNKPKFEISPSLSLGIEYFSDTTSNVCWSAAFVFGIAPARSYEMKESGKIYNFDWAPRLGMSTSIMVFL